MLIYDLLGQAAVYVVNNKTRMDSNSCFLEEMILNVVRHIINWVCFTLQLHSSPDEFLWLFFAARSSYRQQQKNVKNKIKARECLQYNRRYVKINEKLFLEMKVESVWRELWAVELNYNFILSKCYLTRSHSIA